MVVVMESARVAADILVIGVATQSRLHHDFTVLELVLTLWCCLHTYYLLHHTSFSV